MKHTLQQKQKEVTNRLIGLAVPPVLDTLQDLYFMDRLTTDTGAAAHFAATLAREMSQGYKFITKISRELVEEQYYTLLY